MTKDGEIVNRDDDGHVRTDRRAKRRAVQYVAAARGAEQERIPPRIPNAARGATEEVADGAAVLVDPFDPADIASGIERAVLRRDELVRRGLERVRTFGGWSAVADATVEVYRELA